MQKAKIRKEKEGQKKKKLEQLKKDETACDLYLHQDRLRKAVKKIIFHLLGKIKGFWYTASHLFIFFNSFEITVTLITCNNLLFEI